MDFASTILSRFDLIFMVRDVRDEERDLALAAHVFGVHSKAQDGASASKQAGNTEKLRIGEWRGTYSRIYHRRRW